MKDIIKNIIIIICLIGSIIFLFTIFGTQAFTDNGSFIKDFGTTKWILAFLAVCVGGSCVLTYEIIVLIKATKKDISLYRKKNKK